MTRFPPGDFFTTKCVEVRSGRRMAALVRWCAGSLAVLAGICALPLQARAERLPVRVYTTADGLPSNQVACLRRDSHGFLWFCTPEGLSRFDGYTFTNYGVEQGLPDPVVIDFLETREGGYWVGTGRGVALFNPAPSPNHPMFTVYGVNETGPVNSLVEDSRGVVWLAAAKGVFCLLPSQGSWSLRLADFDFPTTKSPEALLQDHNGYLWVAVLTNKGSAELWRRSPDGTVSVFSDRFFKVNRIVSLMEDRQGRIWLSTYFGLALLSTPPQPGGRLIKQVFAKWDGQKWPEIGPVYETSDGRLLASSEGRYEILTDARGLIHFKLFDREAAISADDSDGNLWYANRKTARTGFVSYGTADGLAAEDIRAVLEGQDGNLYAVSGLHNRRISRFDGDRFTSVAPKVPGHAASWDWWGWGWGQIHLQDHTGEWWVATGFELLRYPKVKRLEELASTPPKARYPLVDVFRLYEDSRGDIWIGSWHDGLSRWQRSSGRFDIRVQAFPEPTAFREDRAGNVWLGAWGGNLVRYHGGSFTTVIEGSTLPGTIFSLFLDHAGRLWAGKTRSGLIRIDDPTAEHPAYKVYSTKDGLSSNDVRAITEDRFGRIYFWTGRGVDRLNPDTGKIRHYTEADGLVPAGADHNVAYCDRKGRLWFGLNGLSRLDPQPDRPLRPPSIRVTKVRIRGVDYPVSELGETDLSGLVLRPNENQVQIEFASIGFDAANPIKYQYKLEGAESDWSAPSDLRIVNFPYLPSGTYRFLVRAVNADGLVSPVPAAVGMRLLPPLWKRWWSVSAASLLAFAIVFQVYRYRVRRLLELQRLRTRIATDLHDDIGSSLTQIAIMSEVARKQSGIPTGGEPLGRIADLSRELVDSMSDIVWAINPRRDHLGDLAQRMRRFVSDVLEGADIEVTFHAPSKWADTALNADVRREVFLVFKESVNNIARHAECRRAEVRVDLKGSELWVELRDDGKGFQADSQDGQGHGLASMQERARRIGAKLELTSEPGQGTTVTLRVPLGRATSIRRAASPKR